MPCAEQSFSWIDHLIRPQQQRRRDGEPERLGGLRIDHELEVGGWYEGKISWVGTFENAIDVGGGL